MNNYQKIILFAGAVLATMALLFPTWSISTRGVEIITIRMPLYSSGPTVIGQGLKKNNMKNVPSFPNAEPDCWRTVSEVAAIIILTCAVLFIINRKI